MLEEDSIRQARTVATMVLQCPIRSVVPVQAIARMVVNRRSVMGTDPVQETHKPIATGPGACQELRKKWRFASGSRSERGTADKSGH